MNKSSARDYLYNFSHLMEGEKFTRTLNTDSMEYFFEFIFKDFGIPSIKNAIKSLKLHVEYYEAQQKNNSKMHTMRAIITKYSALVSTPILVSDLNQIVVNINTLKDSLSQDGDIKIEAANLLIRGTCFIAYYTDGEFRFAPSRFVGYLDNKPLLHAHLQKDGRETNKAIKSILKSSPIFDAILEQHYLNYCNSLGLSTHLNGAFNVQRKYWKLELDNYSVVNEQLTGEFPEGKIVERTHKIRERNNQVIKVAKQIFKLQHGKLFCQVCLIDFESKYGSVGKDFIEAHHTIAVCNMPPGYKTKLEEIAMLCSNCHSMVHKRRPWLTMEDLHKLIQQ